MQNLVKTQSIKVADVKIKSNTAKEQQVLIKKLPKVKEGIQMSKRSNCC